MITNDKDVHVKLNSGLPWQKRLFTSKLDLNLREERVKCYIWSLALYSAVPKLWHFGK